MYRYIKRQESIRALDIDFSTPGSLWETLQQIESICSFSLIYVFGDRYPFLEVETEQDTIRFEQGDFICFDEQENKIFKMNNKDFHERWF